MNSDGNTPRLHAAIENNDEEWFRFLITHKADVNFVDSLARTPLHLAIECKKYDLAKFLLENGAIFDIEDVQRKSPLQKLVTDRTGTKSSGYNEIVNLLQTLGRLFSKHLETSWKEILKFPISSDKVKASPLRYFVNGRN